MGADDPAMLATAALDPALDATAASMATTPRSGSSTSLVRGTMLGPYVVLDQLGAGGMGVVVAAYDPRLDRKIAVKLLRAETGGTAQRTRLLREAQAMAQIAHPNVINVFDVGEAGERIYVAMEYVEGGTLSDWLHREPRTWRDVVDAFVAAGRGLVAAHSAGLVHRDFKPENVLAGKDGRMRVTDFGLVAAERDDADGPATDVAVTDGGQPVPAITALSTPLTMAGSVMGTPMYMAPEQHRGDVTGPETDQFSFCAALYLALWKQQPFEGAIYTELMHNVVEGKLRPPPPSGVPEKIRAAIVKGLATKPADRHGTMEQLLAELEPPVPAQGKTRVILAAAGVVAIAAISAVVLWPRSAPAATCKGFELRLAGIWDADLRGRMRTAFTSVDVAWAIDAFDSTATALDGATGRWLKVRVETCEAARDREVAQPVIDARLTCLDQRRVELGALTALLARASDARTLEKAPDAALALEDPAGCRQARPGQGPSARPTDAATGARLEALEKRYAAVEAMAAIDQYAEAKREAEALRPEVTALGYVPLEARLAITQGALAGNLGQPGEARGLLLDAVEIAGRSMVAEHVVDAWRHVVLLAVDARDRATITLAVTALRSALGLSGIRIEDRPLLLNDLAGAAYALGDYETARTQFEAALARVGDNEAMRATVLANYGLMLFRVGDLDAAEQRQREAMELNQKLYGPRSSAVADSLGSLGTIARARGNFDEAIRMFQQSLELKELRSEHESQAVSRSLQNLGNSYASARRAEEARAALEESTAIVRRMQGIESYDYARSLNNLGAFYFEVMHDPAKALPYFEQALEIMRKRLGEAHPEALSAEAALATLLDANGRNRDAIRLLGGSLARAAMAYGDRSNLFAERLNTLGDLERAADPVSAEKRFRLALEIFVENKNRGDAGIARSNLADIEIERGHHAAAVDLARTALEDQEAAFGDTQFLAFPLTNLGVALTGAGRAAEAIPFLERAVTLRENEDPGLLARSTEALARARKAAAR